MAQYRRSKHLELHRPRPWERGITLLEALIALVLVSIVLLTHIQALIYNEQTYNRNRRNSLAMQQAIDIIERYKGRDLDLLGDSNDFTESNVLYNGIRFNRSLDVTANADASVTLAVTVAPVITGYSGSATLTYTYALPNSR